jgi:Zn-dependent protease
LEFSKTEIIHLLIAMALVAMVGFSMNGYRHLSPYLFVIFGFSFLTHEFSHKFIARYYCRWAEFRVSIGGMTFTSISAMPFIPFKFVSPGEVMTSICDYAQLGKVALMGPLVNILLCIVFYIVSDIDTDDFFSVGANFNSWVAVFNLIPFLGSDGEKVFSWDKKVWAFSFGLAVLLFVLTTGRFL